MIASKACRGYGPCLAVHLTFRQAHRIAIENTGEGCTRSAVHQLFIFVDARSHARNGGAAMRVAIY
jgi:hypothetical protein